MRILIIEDNVELGTSLSDTLTAQNYQCDVAENIGDAKYYLDIRNYDLVLLAWSQEDENRIDLVAGIQIPKSCETLKRLTYNQNRYIEPKLITNKNRNLVGNYRIRFLLSKNVPYKG